MRTLVVVMICASIGLAGCASDPDAATALSGDLAVFVDPISDDHDHAVFADHAFSTPSMALLGHTTMSEDGKPFSYIGEMDTHGNLTVVQILGRGSMPGFVVIDTSDPAAPTPIGRAEMPYSYVVDVKWSPDGKYVFAAAQAGTNRQRSDAGPADDPFGYAATANGFTQWDMTDPTKPVAIAGGAADPTGCHMLSVKQLRGELTVFCAYQGLVVVYQYTGGGAWTQVSAFGHTASPVGSDQLLADALAAGVNAPFEIVRGVGPHDMTIQDDPLQPGRAIASVSVWDLGVRFYDVTDPQDPVALGGWGGEGAHQYEGNVHGAALYEYNEMRLAIVGPELLGDSTPALWVLDVTDMSNPTILGEWIPPGEHTSQGLLLTTHQFQIVNDRIYLAYNHAGIWVLDLPTILRGGYAEDAARPDVLGYYLPHEEVELFDPDIAAVPNTWDVNVKGGVILASDRYTGFYTIQYAGDTLGDPAITSST